MFSPNFGDVKREEKSLSGGQYLNFLAMNQMRYHSDILEVMLT